MTLLDLTNYPWFADLITEWKHQPLWSQIPTHLRAGITSDKEVDVINSFTWKNSINGKDYWLRIPNKLKLRTTARNLAEMYEEAQKITPETHPEYFL